MLERMTNVSIWESFESYKNGDAPVILNVKNNADDLLSILLEAGATVAVNQYWREMED